VGNLKGDAMTYFIDTDQLTRMKFREDEDPMSYPERIESATNDLGSLHNNFAELLEDLMLAKVAEGESEREESLNEFLEHMDEYNQEIKKIQKDIENIKTDLNLFAEMEGE